MKKLQIQNYNLHFPSCDILGLLAAFGGTQDPVLRENLTLNEKSSLIANFHTIQTVSQV